MDDFINCSDCNNYYASMSIAYDNDGEAIEYELKLNRSEDPMTLILVCTSSRPLSSDEYAQALISYAEQISPLASTNIHTIN